MVKRKYFEVSKNKNTTQQNLCDAAKAVFGEKFIMLNVYIEEKKDLKLSH